MTRLSLPGIRQMTNVFYTAVHAATYLDNVVIAGALSPFRSNSTFYVAPARIRFMRDLLRMSAGGHPRPTCDQTVHFDIWAHHPYTSGGPTHTALNPDDVSIGDLPEHETATRRGCESRACRQPTDGSLLGNGVQLGLPAC